MVEYKIIFSRLADKDKKLLKQAGLEDKTKELLNLMTFNPFQTPPSYEKLRGNLENYYSRRISYQHRLVYRVNEIDKEIYVVRMWTHYEQISK